RKGCKPVFCDIREDNYTMDPSKIEALITPETVAIMPVHVYGNMCDVNAIQKIADKHGLKVIYDAAHAFGVEKDGIPAGRFGDASMFSFHATKVFNSIEGGCVTTADPVLADTMTKWRNYGIIGPEDVVYVGGNAKMNEFSAAMGICNLRHVDDKIRSRAKVAARYQSHLDGVPGLDIWHAEEGVKPNYSYFPIMVDPEVFGCTRDDVFAYLAQNRIGTRKYFYPLTSDFECFAGMFDSAKDTPIAKRMADRVLTLPMYAGLPMEDVDLICKLVLDCRKQ
ncbi:MAG: DegT/DnrJ/EryC1/StrS family aminotransferase, partial [Atopobiaceae bacterium]|nr:DegT/DnrJ/EryC1/StrS family aminotransferase [Atopobiaceae bacterium]